MLSFYEVAHFGTSRFTERNYPARIVSRCSRLQDLELEFREAQILKFVSVEDEVDHVATRLLTPDEIRVMWAFRKLFMLKKLRFVKFCCTIRHWQLEEYGVGLGKPTVLRANLTAVLEEGFARHIRKPTLSVEVAAYFEFLPSASPRRPHLSFDIIPFVPYRRRFPGVSTEIGSA